MNDIGIFTPEQARQLWQDYQSRKLLAPQISQNYPQRRIIDEVSPHRVFVKNTSAETCPAYGCLEITGTDVVGGRTVIKIRKPATLEGEYLFNSQFAIAPGETGWAYRFGVVIMLGDALGDPPTAANVEYRPTVGAWTIEEGDGPFVVFGPHNATEGSLIGRFSGQAGSDSGSREAVQIINGIVRAKLGPGYYRVEISAWAGETPDCAESGSDTCSPCDQYYTGSGEEETCPDISLPDYQPQTVSTGDPVYVTAYHIQSFLVPLLIDSDVLMVFGGDYNDGSGSEEITPIYRIIDGTQTHTVQYREEYVCCENTGDMLRKKQAIIFAALVCEEQACDGCAESSGSGSGSV